MREPTRLALHSFRKFAGMSVGHKLHLRHTHNGEMYMDYMGSCYKVFRETSCEIPYDDRPVTILVGFRLKFLGNSSILHWLFQRICIGTTPFWSGLYGFRTKLWMVEPETHDYLGIYDWRGQDAARIYLGGLLPVLRKLAVRGTVWYEIYNQELITHLQQNTAELNSLHSPNYISAIMKTEDVLWQKAIQNT